MVSVSRSQEQWRGGKPFAKVRTSRRANDRWKGECFRQPSITRSNRAAPTQVGLWLVVDRDGYMRILAVVETLLGIVLSSGLAVSVARRYIE